MSTYELAKLSLALIPVVLSLLSISSIFKFWAVPLLLLYKVSHALSSKYTALLYPFAFSKLILDVVGADDINLIFPSLTSNTFHVKLSLTTLLSVFLLESVFPEYVPKSDIRLDFLSPSTAFAVLANSVS